LRYWSFRGDWRTGLHEINKDGPATFGISIG
jgi:hypothetical protein